MDNLGPNPKTKYLLFAIVVIGVIFSAFVLTSLMPKISVAETSLGNGSGNRGGKGTDTSNVTPNTSLPEISAEGANSSSSFEIFGVTQTPYIRTSVGEIYQSGEWSIASDTNSSIYNGDYLSQTPAVYTNATDGSVLIEGDWSGFIPALYYSNELDLLNATAYYYPQLYIFSVVDEFDQPYIDEYTHYSFSDSLLNSESVNTQASATYLEVPTSLNSTLQAIIDKIDLSQASSDYQKILLIQDYLKTNYVYDLNYTRAPAGQDPVIWFLQYEKRGVCTNFNSALVLLLRYIGIPSRLVVGYNINSTAEYQQVTSGQAHAWAEVDFSNLGWVEFDATTASNGSTSESNSTSTPTPTPTPSPTSTPSPTPTPTPTPTLIPTNTTITSVSSWALRGGYFSAQGVVTDYKGNPVSGLSVSITLKIDKNDSVGFVCGLNTTDAEGKFNILCQIPQNVSLGSYQVIASTLGNTVYAGSNSDPTLQVNSATKISATSSGPPLVGQPFSIYAQLVDDSQTPIANQTLTLSYMNGTQKEQAVATTNETGYATLSFGSLPQTADNTLNYTVYFNQTGNYVSSEFDGQLNMLNSILEINLTQSGNATIGQSYNVTAQLTNSTTENPVPDTQLTLNYSLGDQVVQMLATTNQTGFATFSFSSFPQTNESKLDYTVYLSQANSSWPTEANGQININSISNINSVAQSSFWNSPLFYAIVIAAIASAAAICFIFYKKRKSKLTNPSFATPVIAPLIVEAKNSDNVVLKIVFPLIKSPFPDIWGVGDLFQAEIHLKKNDLPVNGTIEVQFGDEPFKKLSTENEGIAKIDFQTKTKGAYLLTAKYSQPNSKEIVVQRSIKIVDYTEEIVSIYKETFDFEKNNGVPLGVETSPREFQAAILQNSHFEDKSSLNSFVQIFEIANYSLYNLGRTDYEKMFLSALSIKQASQAKGGQN